MLDDILNHILMMTGRLLVTATAWIKVMVHMALVLISSYCDMCGTGQRPNKGNGLVFNTAFRQRRCLKEKKKYISLKRLKY